MGINKKTDALRKEHSIRAVGGDDDAIGISKKRKGQCKLLGKQFVACGIILTHTKDRYLLREMSIVIAKSAGFFCTAGRVIFWVKIEKEPATEVIM